MDGSTDALNARSAVLKAARPDVIEETFEGEVTIVHLATGVFYGLNEPASAIWHQVCDGRRPETVVTTLAGAYGVPADELHDPVLAFVTELAREQLLAEADAEGPPAATGELGAWAPPKLQRFADMQELLLLDPVHDIELDANGWPIPRPHRAEGVHR
jgi:hypothetical protein